MKMPKDKQHYNKFSILNNEEIQEQADEEIQESESPKNLHLVIRKKAKKAKKKHLKPKSVVKIVEKILATSDGIFNMRSSLADKPDMLRCDACFSSHFPVNRFCRQHISRKLARQEIKPETKFDPFVPDIDLLHYCITFLEMKYKTCGCNCSCYEEEKTESHKESVRLRGGAGVSGLSTSNLIASAVHSAKKHGINLCAGELNKADGNCAFDAVISNINQRICFPSKLSLPSSVYRQIWITELEALSSRYPTLGAGYSNEERIENWNRLKKSGEYEIEFFGDLVMNAIAKGCNKDILIFNTSVNAADPIYVIQANEFGGFVDSDIPVVLAYNQVHYESMHPATEFDVEKTKKLMKDYIEGTYSFKQKDIPFLISPGLSSSQSTTKSDKSFQSAKQYNIGSDLSKSTESEEDKNTLTLEEFSKIMQHRV